MAQSWCKDVNRRFFGVNRTPKPNVRKVSFESGKDRTYLLNSSVKRTFSANLTLTKAEEIAFWDWYDNVVLSGSDSFILPDILTGIGEKEYKFVGEPSVDGVSPRKLTVTIMEE